MTSESVEELRAVENERLDTMQMAVWDDAVKVTTAPSTQSFAFRSGVPD